MNRTDLTLIFVSAIVIAMVVGWCAHWMFNRLNHAPHDPEIGNDEDPLQIEMDARVAAEAELERVHSDYLSENKQLKAELEATMDGLGHARQKSDALQAELDALKADINVQEEAGANA